MLNRKELIAYVTANGLDNTSPDTLRIDLISNEWSADDIDAAVTLLKTGDAFFEVDKDTNTSPEEVPDPNVKYVSEKPKGSDYRDRLLSRVHTNRKLDPAAISSLLGVEVDFTDDTAEIRKVIRTPRMSGVDQVIAVFLAVMLSAGILFGSMYYYEFGLFHHTSSFATYFK